MAALKLNRGIVNLMCRVVVWAALAGEANADDWPVRLEDRQAKPISSGLANSHLMPTVDWDNGPRQQWGYIGAGLNGATWGVQRADGVDDQLTYGDFRAVLGWESTPTPEPGMPFTRGSKIGAEIGYVFSRDFEFDDDGSKTRLDDTLMLRGSVSF